MITEDRNLIISVYFGHWFTGSECRFLQISVVFLRHHIASGCIHRKAASYLGGPAPKERARITILFGCHQFQDLCLVYSKRGHNLIITQQPFTKGCSMEMNEGLSTKCSRISLKNSSRRPRYSLINANLRIRLVSTYGICTVISHKIPYGSTSCDINWQSTKWLAL